MEIGVFTFADVRTDPVSGERIGAERRLAELLEEAELADEVGLDVFGVGEHHRPDFAVSTPAVVLAAIAARTERIRLTSAVTVLSSDDPVRVFQEFSTVDLLSGGRAEIMVGRGSFIESFPLFGYELRDYDRLFEEKLVELLHVRGNGVTSSGHAVHPPPVQRSLPVWVAVGGTPESAVRAGMLALPMALAIIGGLPERFAPFAELHRRAAREAGHDPVPALSINSHGYIADTPEQALDGSFPYVSAAMNRIGRERGWPPLDRADYDAAATLRGANFVGSPEQVVEKILFQHELFGHDRFLLQFTIGGIPHEGVLRSIELLGREVAPAVRETLAARTAP
ncbi:MAG TPA: LLM class flavin-dependent oxidoreductase [Gaiellaceae bacterium]|nr:LLM class flavin-dependent oxidoreductase [Gaiellaceae bacterium]